MKIREFQKTDVRQVANLFRDTVRQVCKKDYTPEQILTWAPDQIDELAWTDRFSKTFTLVAENENSILGFANLEANGNVDMFYVHAEWQSSGIGKALLADLEEHARETKIHSLSSDVSITARPFFLKMGFKIEKEYTKCVHGTEFKNTIMTKILYSEMKFNALIPELTVSNHEKSLGFYLDLLGFKAEYSRPEELFSFLSLGDAQLMIEQAGHHWETATLTQPYGRGINFQIEVDDLTPILEKLKQAGYPLFKEPFERRYPVRDQQKGQKQFLVLDPDGYLLRFYQPLPER